MKNTYKVIGIGEILWDLLPEGKQLGGAPTNFSFHAAQLGLQSSIVSAVGNDILGNEIIETLNSTEIRIFIDNNNKPTGTVSVTLDTEGVPSYVIHEDVAWDYINPSNDALDYASSADAICFGSLAQRSETSHLAILSLLMKSSEHALKVFDINMRQQYYSKKIIMKSLELANALKINEEEIMIFAEMFGLSGDEYELMHVIKDQFRLDYLALTKGDKGSWLVSNEEESYLDTPHIKVKDTVGAGDSFTAAMTAGLLRKKSLKEIHKLAVEVSAFVCTHKGATPELPENLLRSFQT